MNKSLKYVLIGVGAVLALMSVAVAAFVATFDPNAYKAEAAQAVKDATGRELAIAGDLELELFPWLALKAGRVELGNAAGFSGPFASLEGLEARVRVAPLLRGELEIGAVVLRGVTVALAVDAEGRDNWSDLDKGGGMGADTSAATPATTGSALRFSVAGVRIDGATLGYSDAQSSASASLHLKEFETGAIATGIPLRFKGSAELSSTAPALKAAVGFNGVLTAEHSLEQLEVELDAEGDMLPAPLKDAQLSIAKVAMGEPLAITGLQLRAWGLELSGDLALAAGADAAAGSRLTGHLEAAEFAPRGLLKAFGIAVPATADPKALSSMKFTFDLEQQGDKLALDKLKLMIDGTTLSGRIALDSIERSALRFDLSVDAFDADRYLPPPAPAAEPAADGGIETLALPRDALRGHDIAGTLRAGKLAVAKVDLSDLRVSLVARDGRLTVKPFGAALYGGKVQGEAALDARGEVPAASIRLALAGVRIGDLLKDAFDSNMVSGAAKLDLDLAGHGETVGALKRDLDGTVRFEVVDGVIEGFNLWKEVRLGWAKYKKHQTAAASEPDRTPFESVRGGASVTDGVATLEDVRAIIQFAEATAKGRIDLGASRLKVEAKAKITAAPEFGPGENLTDLKGVTLPVGISGPFAKPKIDVDMTKAAISMLKPDGKLKKKLKGLIG